VFGGETPGEGGPELLSVALGRNRDLPPVAGKFSKGDVVLGIGKKRGMLPPAQADAAPANAEENKLRDLQAAELAKARDAEARKIKLRMEQRKNRRAALKKHQHEFGDEGDEDEDDDDDDDDDDDEQFTF
jgi:hypothetical protein